MSKAFLGDDGDGRGRVTTINPVVLRWLNGEYLQETGWLMTAASVPGNSRSLPSSDPGKLWGRSI